MLENLMYEAKHYAEIGKYDKAIDVLHKALVMNPDNGLAYYLMGLCNQNLEKYEVVVDNCQESLRCGFSPALVNYLLSCAYFELSEYALADRHFWVAYLYNPNDSVALARYGFYMFLVGEFNESQYLMKKALEIDPDNPQVRFFKNHIAITINDEKIKQEAITDMMNSTANEFDKLVFLGNYYCREKQCEQAVEVFKQAYTIDPDRLLVSKLEYCEQHSGIKKTGSNSSWLLRAFLVMLAPFIPIIGLNLLGFWRAALTGAMFMVFLCMVFSCYYGYRTLEQVQRARAGQRQDWDITQVRGISRVIKWINKNTRKTESCFSKSLSSSFCKL